MAGKKTDDAPQAVDIAELAAFLKKLPSEQMHQLMQQTGQAPSMQGFTPEMLATILQSSGQQTALALKRAGQRECLTYHNRSVFDPTGRFDDEGNSLPAKVSFKYDTYYIGVLIGRAGMSGDSSTPAETELYNRFEHDMDAHGGTWTARFETRGDSRTLSIEVPVESVDDRMGIPEISLVLLTLLEGEESVNAATLLSQVKTLRDDRKDEATAFKALQVEMAALKASIAGETPDRASPPA